MSLRRRDALRAAGVGALTALAGCTARDPRPFTAPSPAPGTWPRAGYDAVNSAHNPDASGPRDPPDTAWVADTGVSVESLVVGPDRVYVGGSDRAAAITRDTGDVAWAVEATSETLALGHDALYAGGTDVLQALAPATGDQHWERRESRAETRAILPTASAVLAGGYDGVHAHDPDTGDERWRVDVRAGGRTAVALADGRVYAACAHVVFALERRRLPRALWRDEPRTAWRTTDATRNAAGITVTDDSVIVGDHAPQETAVAPRTFTRTGDPTGALAATGEYAYPPAVTDDAFVVATGTYVEDDTDTGAVVALDRTGGERWRHTVDAAPARPVTDGTTVYYGAYDGTPHGGPTAVHAVDLATGDERWRRVLGRDAHALALTPDALYAGARDGRVTALR